MSRCLCISNLRVRLFLRTYQLLLTWFSYSLYLSSADEFNERRLLATAFAALEVQCQYTRSRLVKGRSQVSALRQRCIISKWQCAIIDLRNVRYAKEVKAKRNGSRLCLMRALQSWRSGAKENRKEREIRLMIEAKRRQVNNWLEGNRC